MEGLLAGIRVVDLSWGLAGPVATQLLAEAGADVIKVEPPGGDPMRSVSAGFATWNRSKRGVVLDLGLEEDRARLDRLLGTADVLVHGLRPHQAQQLGLGDAALADRFPSLIPCAVLGYPIAHPDAERPGWDALVQARLGLMDEQVGHRDGPVFLRFPVPSWGAAYLAAAGVLARLLARHWTGRAGPAHTRLLQGALVTLPMHWARAQHPTPSLESGLPKHLVPSLYRCADGVWIHVMAASTRVPLMVRTLEELGEERVRRARAEQPASYFGDHGPMALAFRQRPSAEWLEALWACDVPVLPALAPGEVLVDEQAALNGYVVDVEDPVWGRCRQAGPPVHTTPPSQVRSPAPVLGQHTAEVLGPLDAPSGPHRLRGPVAGPTAATAPEAVRVYPLEGVRVLDLGNYLAGPFAAMLLGDLGADVVKLEAPTGDLMRGVERVFAGCQRNKRGVAVDLKHEGATDVVRELVRWADVVHHNLRAPAARKLGIDYESLRAVNPSIVYCHTTAYGPHGPRTDWPGYDQLFQAYSGWEVAGGGEGNPPMWHRMGMMDHQNALASLVATLLGLWHRARTGEGQFVAASILGASTLTASETLLRGDGSLVPVPPLDHDQTGMSSGYRIYQVADGWVAVVAWGPERLAALRAVAGATSEDAAEIASGLRQAKAGDVLRELAAAGLDAELVTTDQMDAFFASPDNVGADLVARYEHPVYGELEQIGALWSFGDLSVRLDRPPPTLGQHTAEVLAEVGFDPGAIQGLAAAGVIAGDGLVPA